MAVRIHTTSSTPIVTTGCNSVARHRATQRRSHSAPADKPIEPARRHESEFRRRLVHELRFLRVLEQSPFERFRFPSESNGDSRQCDHEQRDSGRWLPGHDGEIIAKEDLTATVARPLSLRSSVALPLWLQFACPLAETGRSPRRAATGPPQHNSFCDAARPGPTAVAHPLRSTRSDNA